MAKITENFTREEFDSKDGVVYPEKWIKERLTPLCEALEKIRIKIGKPIIITSGYRSPKHNASVGGAKGSMHVEGIACDFKSKGLTGYEIGDIVEELVHLKLIPNGGIGFYKGWCHYDIRGIFFKEVARWRK